MMRSLFAFLVLLAALRQSHSQATDSVSTNFFLTTSEGAKISAGPVPVARDLLILNTKAAVTAVSLGDGKTKWSTPLSEDSTVLPGIAYAPSSGPATAAQAAAAVAAGQALEEGDDSDSGIVYVSSYIPSDTFNCTGVENSTLPSGTSCQEIVLYAMDHDTGYPLWIFVLALNTTDKAMKAADFISAPAVYGDAAFVATQQAIYAVLAGDRTGGYKFTVDLAEALYKVVPHVAPIVYRGGAVFVTTTTGDAAEVGLLGVRNDSASAAWTYTLGEGAVAALVHDDDFVFAQWITKDGVPTATSLDVNGNKLGEMVLSGLDPSHPFTGAISNGYLYVVGIAADSPDLVLQEYNLNKTLLTFTLPLAIGTFGFKGQPIIRSFSLDGGLVVGVVVDSTPPLVQLAGWDATKEGALRWSTHIPGELKSPFFALTQPLVVDGDGNQTVYLLLDDNQQNNAGAAYILSVSAPSENAAGGRSKLLWLTALLVLAATIVICAY